MDELRRARLNGNKDFEGFDLTDMDFIGSGLLAGCNLRGARFEVANLSGARLHEADLRDAKLNHADLSGAHLQGADLRCSNLLGVDLRYADLREPTSAEPTSAMLSFLGRITMKTHDGRTASI